MTSVRKIVATTLIFLVVEGYSAFASAATEYHVIVNRSNETSNLDRKYLAEIFMKKTTQWRNNRIIVPVDLVAESHVRGEFSVDVLGRTVGAVRMYWQQQLFSGRGIPPPELKSERDVIDFVSAHPDAIGYVSDRADVHNVKIVQVED